MLTLVPWEDSWTHSPTICLYVLLVGLCRFALICSCLVCRNGDAAAQGEGVCVMHWLSGICQRLDHALLVRRLHGARLHAGLQKVRLPCSLILTRSLYIGYIASCFVVSAVCLTCFFLCSAVSWVSTRATSPPPTSSPSSSLPASGDTTLTVKAGGPCCCWGCWGHSCPLSSSASGTAAQH